MSGSFIDATQTIQTIQAYNAFNILFFQKNRTIFGCLFIGSTRFYEAYSNCKWKEGEKKNIQWTDELAAEEIS